MTWGRQLLKACCLRPSTLPSPATLQIKTPGSECSSVTRAPFTNYLVHLAGVGSLRALIGTAMKAGNSSSAKRIQKELAEISLDPPGNCSAGPKGDNIYEWVSTIMGPSGGRVCRSLVPPVAVSLNERHCPNSLLRSRHRCLAPTKTSTADFPCSIVARACPERSAMPATFGAQGLPTQAAYFFLTFTSRQTIPSSRPRLLLARRSPL